MSSWQATFHALTESIQMLVFQQHLVMGVDIEMCV